MATGRTALLPAPKVGREQRSLRALLERVLGAIARSALRFGRVPPGREAAIKVELAALVVTGRPTFAMAERGDGPRARTAASFIPVGATAWPRCSIGRDRGLIRGRIFQQGTGAGANLPDIHSSRERVSSRPIAVGLPFGVTLELLPTHLPLPAKIRPELLEPIQLDPDPDPERASDERYVEQAYQDVERRIQQGVDRLATKRRFPVFG